MDNSEFTNSDLETVLARQIAWIQTADTRAGFILPLATSMLGVIVALIPKDTCAWELWPLFFALSASLLLALSLLFVAFASFPRTTGPEGSLIFFGGIASLDLENYKKKVNELTAMKYRDDLIAQCHRNGQIADKKYYWVKQSMRLVFLSLPFWALAVFMLFNLGK